MKLEITKEKVLEAAEKCSQAKETLKTLFPECFEKEMPDIEPFKVNTDILDKLIFISRGFAPHGLSDKCFGLSIDYSWTIEKNDGFQILIPKPKF